MRKNLTKKEYCWRAAETVLSVAVAVLALLQLTGKWDGAINAAMPLMGAELLLQTRREWGVRRGHAVFTLCTALFVLGCGAAVFLL